MWYNERKVNKTSTQPIIVKVKHKKGDQGGLKGTTPKNVIEVKRNA